MTLKTFFINRLKDKTIKGLEWKLLVNNIIFIILILFMFKGLYRTAELIDYEIQFQNYLDNLKMTSNYIIDLNSTGINYGLVNVTQDTDKIIEDTLIQDPDILEFPKSFKYLIGVTFFLLLNSLYYVIYLYNKYKKIKKEKGVFFTPPPYKNS